MRFAASIGVSLLCLLSFGQSADQKQLDSLTAAYSAAKATYKSSHGSAKARHNLVVATDKLATATMTSEVLSPRTRYPQALALYQGALNLEPKDVEAKNNAAMIDSVYKGMIAGAKAKMMKDPKDKEAAATYARLTSVYKQIHRPIP